MQTDISVDESMASRLQSLQAIWTSVQSSSVVSFHSAFTTTEMGDTSIIVVTDFHAQSTVLAKSHSATYGNAIHRRQATQFIEKVVWNLMVQIANAIKAIHSIGLAARLVDASKMLMTDENRVRFNGCAIADILDPTDRSVGELQQQDLEAFGDLLVWLVTLQPRQKPLDQLLRGHSPRFTNAVEFLVQRDAYRTIDTFIELISSSVIDSFDASLHLDDTLQFSLSRELENSRITRLMLRLNVIIDRPEYEDDPNWTEYGSRGQLRLFRDYVFHQVDSQGRPVPDFSHMIACLNKLDVGIDEKIPLSTRDGKTVIIVTYREMKIMLENTWLELKRHMRS